MNVLVSIDESKIEHLKALGIIDDSNTIYRTGDYSETKEQINPAFASMQQTLSKSTQKPAKSELNETEILIREASEDSQADDYYLGKDYYICYNVDTGRLEVKETSEIDNGYDYIDEPFSTPEKAQKCIDALGAEKIINDCNLF